MAVFLPWRDGLALRCRSISLPLICVFVCSALLGHLSLPIHTTPPGPRTRIDSRPLAGFLKVSSTAPPSFRPQKPSWDPPPIHKGIHRGDGARPCAGGPGEEAEPRAQDEPFTEAASSWRSRLRLDPGPTVSRLSLRPWAPSRAAAGPRKVP